MSSTDQGATGDPWPINPYAVPEVSTPARVVEPRLGAVGVAHAFQAVGWGLLLSGAICLMGVMAVAAVGEFSDLEAWTLYSRALALSSLYLGSAGGAIAAVAGTIRRWRSLPVLRATMLEHPQDAVNLAGLRIVDPTGARIVWAAVAGVLAFITGFAWMYFRDTAANPYLAAITLGLIAVVWLGMRGVTRAGKLWTQEWDALRQELGRRRAAADAADERRRVMMPPDPGPTPLGEVLVSRMDRIGGLLLAFALLFFPLAMLLAAAFGKRAPVVATVLAVIEMAPWVLIVLGLLVAALALAVSERRVMAWAARGPRQAADDRGIRLLLLGPRASWLGALALASSSGLVIGAALAGMTPIDGVLVMDVPSWLMPAGMWGVVIALTWALIDVPLTRRERTRLREACAPGDVQPEVKVRGKKRGG